MKDGKEEDVDRTRRLLQAEHVVEAISGICGTTKEFKLRRTSTDTPPDENQTNSHRANAGVPHGRRALSPRLGPTHW